MLRLEGLEIRQGTFRMGADMALEQGRKYAVIGPSGAGKSTLLGALCGFVPLAQGRLFWQGDEITDADPGARPMTMLFQDNNLFPHLSVTQNIGLGIRPDLRLSAQDKTRVAQALARVGLSDQAGKKPGALSGGQQSRAALARVLVQAQPWVLLDEPFAALGPALRNEMLDLVQDLVTETGAGLVMVTHAPEDVRRIADEVVFVGSGRAEAPKPAAELMDNPPPELRAYLG
ncbi:ATP-binding cassette domain-containing protein [Sulfitobacter geojensis]|uniref:ATP-binding cassette domain-containing protein n=1 Tax=Sulfitobacter geojensis TaxID=1342299 RepID=A0AAE2VYB3_9RHOB|nr:ATP-binding cassette domain-containing protein [Sulfitobacter geojensis]MBM1689293.1 ATP-binding cassette domain-containing protein [Sulfitobacter geojensis]MBM1693359.1 ATP-binding cassette domain-containing protein [Sulfitobacter geojensis]MBM1705525.1 ATP-binding cassette domain-containing protein [Sulfitobacter geojensis]MBM1709583.1 ATP-binding cassette domain-containing protein [Sulfitobacter geojensis]MBM1713649.1 ATP-binding cassette domain-containing protein [Sulfitobacter geojensi